MNELRAEGTLDVGGARLEYRAFGRDPAAAPTIVMLHEGLGCVAMWRDFPERLAHATGMSVVAYSREGYGHSSPCPLPRPVTFHQYEARSVLPGVLDAIGFRDGIVLGHSDGASIAAVHAGAIRDERVRGLVLMAPHYFTEGMGIAAIEQAKNAYDSGNLREVLAKYHGDNVDCAFRGWNDVWLNPDFRDWDIREHLPSIETPVLVVQGEDDQYGTRAQVEATRDLCGGPVDVALLADCRHSPHRDQPEQALAAITAFVAARYAGG